MNEMNEKVMYENVTSTIKTFPKNELNGTQKSECVAHETRANLEEILQTVMPIQKQALQLFRNTYGQEKVVAGIGELNYIDIEKGILKILIPSDFFEGRVRYDRNLFLFVDEYRYKDEPELLKSALNSEKKLMPEAGDGFGIAQTNFFIITKRIRGFTKGHKIAKGIVGIFKDEQGAISRACLLFGALYKKRSDTFFKAVEKNHTKLYGILGDIFRTFAALGNKLIKTAYDVLLFKKKIHTAMKNRDDKLDKNDADKFLDSLLSKKYTVEMSHGEKIFHLNPYG